MVDVEFCMTAPFNKHVEFRYKILNHILPAAVEWQGEEKEKEYSSYPP